MSRSLYGSYRTRTFADIYETADVFVKEIQASPLNKLYSESCKTLYYLLYGKYGNSHIASSDETQFKYRLYSIIWQYGPSWKREVDLQDKLRAMSDDEILSGAKSINNVSLNPATEIEEDVVLKTVNQQTTMSVKKAKMDAYAQFVALLKKDVTAEFLNRFKELFLTVVEPEGPLYYITEGDEEDGI